MSTISLCMIVKNEEQFLEQCLNSVKELVDEIIIVDTGSIDRTKEIALKFTPQVYDFNWRDDFSAARNESLKYATGDWILVLDADEVLPEAAHELIKKCIQEEEIYAYFLITRNYTNNSAVFEFVDGYGNPFSNGYKGWFDSWVIRLFRNDPNIYFEGEVHERVDTSLEKCSGKTAMAPLVIHHYGESKSSNINTEKREIYEKLAKLKIKNQPESAAAHYQLGVIFKEKEDFILAETEFKIALELNPNLVGALLDLAVIHQKQNNLDLAINYYSQLLKKKENFSKAYSGLGFCYYHKNDLTNSAYNFEKAIQLDSSYLEARINLGAVYEKQNRFREALNVLAEALKLSPNIARTYYNLGAVHEKMMNLSLALRCYEKALELNYQGDKTLNGRIEKLKQFISSNGSQ